MAHLVLIFRNISSTSWISGPRVPGKLCLSDPVVWVFTYSFFLRIGMYPLPKRVFRRLRKAVLKKLLLHSPCPPFLPAVSLLEITKLLLTRLPWNIILRVSTKSFQHVETLFKIGQTLKIVTWRPTYIYSISSWLVFTLEVLCSLWGTNWGRRKYKVIRRKWTI